VSKSSQASASVMAITKCLISAQTVNRFTRDGESVAPVCPHQPAIGWSTLAYMEKIMSKTKHIESREFRELSVQELETVSGGWFYSWLSLENYEQNQAAKTFKEALQGAAQV
jgi:hypothetical protein